MLLRLSVADVRLAKISQSTHRAQFAWCLPLSDFFLIGVELTKLTKGCENKGGKMIGQEHDDDFSLGIAESVRARCACVPAPLPGRELGVAVANAVF